MISARPRLVIGSNSFCVTHSLLELVKMLFNYLLYARCFQGLGPEVMHRVLDLFKVYNTSSRNLVLNAGAVSQGFLNRISARHIGKDILSCITESSCHTMFRSHYRNGNTCTNSSHYLSSSFPASDSNRTHERRVSDI